MSLMMRLGRNIGHLIDARAFQLIQLDAQGPFRQIETVEHRISWWVYAGSERIPHTAKMRGLWGYDVTCTCGWETRTGGAVRRHIRDEVYFHKLLAQSKES